MQWIRAPQLYLRARSEFTPDIHLRATACTFTNPRQAQCPAVHRVQERVGPSPFHRPGRRNRSRRSPYEISVSIREHVRGEKHSQRLRRNTVDFVAYDGTHVCGVPSTSTRNVTESLLPVAALRSDQSSVHSSIAPVETYNVEARMSLWHRGPR